MEREILTTLGSMLARFGIAAAWESSPDRGLDGVVRLTRGANAQTYAVEAKTRPTLAAVASSGEIAGSLPPLIVADHVSARSASAFRAARLQYVDAAGNAYLHFGDVYVDVRGQVSPRLKGGSPAPTGAGSNLFSARRAQVICALLVSPGLLTERLQDVADASGASIATVHATLRHLRSAGFVTDVGLRRESDLLDLWAAAYATGLGARLALQSLVGDPSAVPVRGSDAQPAPTLSGEAAVDDLLGRLLTLTVYVDRWDPGLAVVNRWKRDPVQPANVFIRRRFWGAALEPKSDDPQRPRLAPWPVVYADLLATGEPRLAEVAATWRARHGA